MKVTKENLKKGADDIFRTSEYKELHATEDGNYFEKISDANAHNIKYVKGEVHTFPRVEAELKINKNASATRDVTTDPGTKKEATQAPVTATKDPEKPAAKNTAPAKTTTPAKPAKPAKPAQKTGNSKPKNGGKK